MYGINVSILRSDNVIRVKKENVYFRKCMLNEIERGLIVSGTFKCLEKKDQYIEVEQIWQNIS